MMSLSKASRSHIDNLSRHNYVCDLINFEGPILSLYRDDKRNWLYLWSDTDGVDTNRWFVFSITRQDLVDYLKQEVSLRELILKTPSTYILDSVEKQVKTESGTKNDAYRKLASIKTSDIPEDHLPNKESFFDPDLTGDIELSRDFVPTSFEIPIDESWFISDLDKFSGIYSQLYGFLYCTTPQFVKNIEPRVREYLRAPWRGGFSRVNLFSAMQKMVPSLHDLRVKRIQYASPGEIVIEALPNIGNLIASVVNKYSENRKTVDHNTKIIKAFLGKNGFNSKDTSSLTDEKLDLPKSEIQFVSTHASEIYSSLGLEDQMRRLLDASPNTVVSAKVIIALVGRIQSLHEFQESSLIKF